VDDLKIVWAHNSLTKLTEQARRLLGSIAPSRDKDA
jgi:hypothetical protein